MPEVVPHVEGYVMYSYRQGEQLKSGNSRLNNSISYKKHGLGLRDLDGEIGVFLKENAEHVSMLISNLSSKGEAFVRIEISADFDSQLCHFNVGVSTLKALVDAGLSFDVVLLEPGIQS